VGISALKEAVVSRRKEGEERGRRRKEIGSP
jgi:hypothetical protein